MTRIPTLGAWGAVVLGGTLALVAAVTACAQRPPGPVGGSAAAALASPGAAGIPGGVPAAPGGGPGMPGGGSGVPGGGPGVPSGGPGVPSGGPGLPAVQGGVPIAPGAPQSATSVVAPVSLRIDRLRLSARVDPVGVDERTGDFAVPPSVDVVGWYRFGPGLDATAGSIVVAGHVDSAAQGGGAFFRLRELGPGDAIAVSGSDGGVRRFTVVAREVYPKTRIPLQRYFARDGEVRLTLITCGGPFDRGTGHYRDNVVITARADTVRY